jgi:pimeloyl-ACP methyl ester carboxylesterase
MRRSLDPPRQGPRQGHHRVRYSYDRSGSTLTEVEGASHFVQPSRPDVIADVIRDAVQATTSSVAA